MLSVLVAIHNTRALATDCLRTLHRTFLALGTDDVEFILINDRSDAEQKIPELLATFRASMPKGTRVTEFHFREHQHYTRALAYGLSAAKGRQVLFVSHDMMIAPDYVRTLLAVSASDERIGLVRGVSPYVDAFPQHRVAAPFRLRSFEDLDAFSRYVSGYWGLAWVEDALLTGDSMLIKREVLDRIGVFDPRYFGYFGDIDFGLRLQRAGYKMACAKGAWLWHLGAAAYKDKSQQTQQNFGAIINARMEVVRAAYRLFREKWDRSLPPEYTATADIPFDRLRAAPPSPADAFVPAMVPDPAICEVR
jgi:GT2 family glycosyltransferase